MRTAEDVLAAIDEELVDLQHAAAGPCIEATLTFVGREEYKEAICRAASFQAVAALRRRLQDRLDAVPPATAPASTARKKRTKAK